MICFDSSKGPLRIAKGSNVTICHTLVNAHDIFMQFGNYHLLDKVR